MVVVVMVGARLHHVMMVVRRVMVRMIELVRMSGSHVHHGVVDHGIGATTATIARRHHT